MLNELFFLQILTLVVLFFFINTVNIITLWYLAGLYLFSLGFNLLIDDADIFVGFLWVIDFGVGLIFFIFILHFSNFLHQKSLIDLSSRFNYYYITIFIFILIFFYFFATPTNNNYNVQLKNCWFFFISWYNYYSIFYSFQITELNLLRELYFYNNSLGFFIINFMLLYGIFASIILCFLIKKVFVYLNIGQIRNYNFLNEVSSIFFIRNQNFLKQQNTSAGTRVWLKRKLSTYNDF